MRRTLAEEQKGVNAGRIVAIWDDTKRYRGLCVWAKRRLAAWLEGNVCAIPAFFPSSAPKLPKTGRLVLCETKGTKASQNIGVTGFSRFPPPGPIRSVSDPCLIRSRHNSF